MTNWHLFVFCESGNSGWDYSEQKFGMLYGNHIYIVRVETLQMKFDEIRKQSKDRGIDLSEYEETYEDLLNRKVTRVEAHSGELKVSGTF